MEKGRIHYVGIIAVYMRRYTVLQNGKESVCEEVRMPLLSVSPMAMDKESSAFAAEECNEDGPKNMKRIIFRQRNYWMTPWLMISQ